MQHILCNLKINLKKNKIIKERNWFMLKKTLIVIIAPILLCCAQQDMGFGHENIFDKYRYINNINLLNFGSIDDAIKSEGVDRVLRRFAEIISYKPKSPMAYIMLMEVYPLFVLNVENLRKEKHYDSWDNILSHLPDDIDGIKNIRKLLSIRTYLAINEINRMRKDQGIDKEIGANGYSDDEIMRRVRCGAKDILTIINSGGANEYLVLAMIQYLALPESIQENSLILKCKMELPNLVDYYSFLKKMEDISEEIVKAKLFSREYNECVVRKFNYCLSYPIEKIKYWDNPLPIKFAFESIIQLMPGKTRMEIVQRLLLLLNDNNDPPEYRTYRATCYYYMAQIYKMDGELNKAKECIIKGKEIAKSGAIIKALNSIMRTDH